MFTPARSYLNLIQSVTTILDIMDRVMKEQNDRLQRQRQTLSPSRSLRSGLTTLPSDDSDLSDDDTRNLPNFSYKHSPPPSYDSAPPDEDARDLPYNFSDEHRSLWFRLQPLIRIRGDLEKYIGSAALEPDQVKTTPHTVFPSTDPGSSRPMRHHTEFFVSAHSSWKDRLSGREGSGRFTEKDPTQGLHDATRILYASSLDIKQLWTDDVVQQVLKGTKAQLEYSSGL